MPTPTRHPPPGPDRDAALAQYQRRASTYDLELAAFEPLRRLAIEQLALQAGETVIDVGCGTGLSLPLLSRAVAPRGHVIGIEQSPEMIERARSRVRELHLHPVRLVCAPAEQVADTRAADAMLFHFTHDVLQRPEAVDAMLRHLRPGGRVVACGLQWAPPWALPLNLFVWGAAMRSVSSLRGLERPWQALERQAGPMQVQSHLMGAVYLAVGRKH